MTLLLTLCMSLPVSAAELEEATFTDVPWDSPWYEAVEYAARQGITVGTGGQQFSPDSQITVRQWAVMLYRAFRVELPEDNDLPFGEAGLRHAYDAGWIDQSALAGPDTFVCRGWLYESAFKAAGLEVYSDSLYDTGEEQLSHTEHTVRIAQENGLCSQDAGPLDVITRGEAVYVLWRMGTTELTCGTPDILSELRIDNVDGLALDEYLLELKKNPPSILDAFRERGWTYRLDRGYLAELSERLGMTCVGAANYQNRTIYISDPRSTIHEMGHFYHSVLRFPAAVEELYQKESASVGQLLGSYAAKNSHEFFAEVYEFWILHEGSSEKLERLAGAAPETFEYFSALAAGGWAA